MPAISGRARRRRPRWINPLPSGLIDQKGTFAASAVVLQSYGLPGLQASSRAPLQLPR